MSESTDPGAARRASFTIGIAGDDLRREERELPAGEPTTALNIHELSDEDRAALGVETLPGNLLDAVRGLESDDVLRTALGNTGREDYVDYYARVKRREFAEAHEQITQWEIDRYLQLY
jgi:glutamine synthetase